MTNQIQREAKQILDTLAFTPFEECQPLSRDFETIPSRIGLYAFRHRTQELFTLARPKTYGTGYEVVIRSFSGGGWIGTTLMMSGSPLLPSMSGNGQGYHMS